jgi:hypothetical protein
VANHHLIAGDAAPLWDADFAFAPWFLLVGDHVRAGRLLSWNPWSGGGSPDFADPQLGAMSPLTTAVSALGGDLAGFWTYWLVIWFAAALGALLLARHLGAPPWGAFVAAAGFSFCGYFTGHATHTSFLHAYAALPWIVWRLDRAMEPHGSRAAAEAGALWGLSALAGYPGQVAANAGFALLWVAGRLVRPADHQSAEPRRRAIRVAAALLIFGFVGVATLSPAYASFFRESQGFSARAGVLPRETAVGSNALHPFALLTFASPYLAALKRDAPDRLWSYTDVTSASIYCGVVAVWLAGLALAGGGRDGWRWWILGCGMIGIVLALGQALPVRGWLYDFLPPTRYVRHAALFRGYLPMSVLALAAIGARDLARGDFIGRTRWRPLIVAGALLCASALAYWVVVGAVGPVAATPSAAVGLRCFVVLWAGVVAVAACAGFRPAWAPAGLCLLAIADGLGTRALSQPLMDDATPAGLARWNALQSNRDRSLRVSWKRRPVSSHGIGNRNLVVKEPVLAAWTPLYNPLHQLWTENARLAAIASGADRVYFAERIAEVPPTMANFTAFAKRTAELKAPPLVLHSRPAMRAGETGPDDRAGPERIALLPAAVRIPTSVLAYAPDVLALAVECPSPGWLWVTERWARSWEATIDGHAVHVWGGNFLFRAVPVPAGRSIVEFHYDPHRRGLVILSWGVLAAVGWWTVGSAVRARSKQCRRG